MAIELWWPTPIYHSEFNEDENSFELMHQEIENTIKTIETKPSPFQFCEFETTFTDEYSFCDKTPLLKKYIEKHIEEYSQIYTKINNLSITESWVNFNGKGHFQEFHEHAGSIISGCYYFDTNGNDGDIVFKPTIDMYRHTNVECSLYPEHVKWTPANGLILLFPSFLNHCVTINKTDHKRISISFNVFNS
jgi:uncharacterized protein (TIGR02466 family)